MDVFQTKTFQQLCGHNFAIFYPAWTVFYPEHEQQQTFFDPLPPHLVQVVIECPLTQPEPINLATS